MSDPDRRFPREVRILRKAEFDLVFREGRSSSDDRLIVYVRPRAAGLPSRLGLVVGRRYGGAVLRNAFKRAVREAFRLSKGELPPSSDLVVLPRFPGRIAGAREMRESLVAVANAAAAVFGRRGPRR